MIKDDQSFLKLVSAAKAGYKLKLGDKTIWAGLGNRSGLHSYLPIALGEKYDKSGPNFEKKILAYPAGTIIEVHIFQNINRDRGLWRKDYTIKI